MNSLLQSGWLAINGTDGKAVFIPRYKKANPFSSSTVAMTVGSRMRKRVHIQPPDYKHPSGYLLPVRLKPIRDKEYKAGPFVAILTSPSGNFFRGNPSNFADIIQTGRRLGVTVFVLTPKGLNQKSDTVQGFLLTTRDAKKRWIPATLPMPDIVYNRIPNRMLEQQIREQNALSYFMSMPEIHLFNPSFFNKWTLFLQMKRSPQLASLLPDTKRWDPGEPLTAMTQNHRVFFLKPINGKAGQGMIRVIREKDGYQVTLQSKQGKIHHLAKNPDSLRNILSSFTQDKSYILQQGIPLAQYKGRPFDLRVLMQKDGSGRWTPTGIGIRVAGKESISTHVPMGGSIANTSSVLRSTFPKHDSAMRKHIEQTAQAIASHIEREEGNNLGEMSLDLGMEASGRLWFFEANAKPMKFDEPNIRKRSLQKLIQYFLYLSGFVFGTRKGG
ncbi:YheC/YheD family protein [Melghirimyces algeriensis]|uniref:YheC/D like ATP-grasp n=1 Tax=Melghirimyces algeriensis TaxID=910412 RepID=A0A521ADW0_9BACL|nr:YheC/YheD family protein [Melghirimyces algeriensis]SMO32961.1 YheC/D like ATP-grasp [Melghirimyces algeriensis]